MTKIKIFNSEEEAGNLKGTLINHKTFLDSGILENFNCLLKGEFTAMQRLKDLAGKRAEILKADYGAIADKYDIYKNNSKSLIIEVNFYKNKK